jgi:hypothetical protein
MSELSERIKKIMFSELQFQHDTGQLNYWEPNGDAGPVIDGSPDWEALSTRIADIFEEGVDRYFIKKSML